MIDADAAVFAFAVEAIDFHSQACCSRNQCLNICAPIRVFVGCYVVCSSDGFVVVARLTVDVRRMLKYCDAMDVDLELPLWPTNNLFRPVRGNMLAALVDDDYDRSCHHSMLRYLDMVLYVDVVEVSCAVDSAASSYDADDDLACNCWCRGKQLPSAVHIAACPKSSYRFVLFD